MLHAESIIPQSLSHDKDLVFQKFATLIDDIVEQFKSYNFDSEIIEAEEAAIPEGEKSDLINQAIRQQCKFLNVPVHLCVGELENYTPKILANLTVNEQLYLISHIDLFALRVDVELPNPIFECLVYSTVRQRLSKKR